jgi:two-component system NarL family sensor kinase
MQIDNSQIILFIIMTTAIIFMLGLLIILILFLYQKKQIAYQRNIQTMKLEFEKNLLKTEVEIQEQTLQDISREIHDNISLSLTLAKLNLNTLDWMDVEGSYQVVKSSIGILGKSIVDMNNLSKSMNTELIRSLGLMKAVKNEVERIEQMARLKVLYEIKGEPIFMDCEKELVVFRIIQEAFNNVIKHAKATKVWLQLDYNTEQLDVLIKDNGIGFSEEYINREDAVITAGLTNIKTRAKLFGGHVLIDSKLHSGTQILVTVPYS